MARELNAERWRTATSGGVLILEFHEGDRIPVEIVLDGEVLTTDPEAAKVNLRAKRTFFLRIKNGELKTSLDGASFDKSPMAPGAFRLGLESAPEGGPLLSLHVTTPTHAKP